VVTDSSATDTTAPPPPDTTHAPPLPGGRYVVQIGAFGSEANATKLTQRALAIGYEATVIPQVRGNATLYLVRVARAGSPADARIASDSLARTLGVNAVVLRPGQ
jgi:cell division septation protein DedD